MKRFQGFRAQDKTVAVQFGVTIDNAGFFDSLPRRLLSRNCEWASDRKGAELLRYQQPCENFLSFELLHFFSQLRDSFEEVGDKAIIGDAEDRCLGILIDRDDHFGIFHSG